MVLDMEYVGEQAGSASFYVILHEQHVAQLQHIRRHVKGAVPTHVLTPGAGYESRCDLEKPRQVGPAPVGCVFRSTGFNCPDHTPLHLSSFIFGSAKVNMSRQSLETFQQSKDSLYQSHVISNPTIYLQELELDLLLFLVLENPPMSSLRNLAFANQFFERGGHVLVNGTKFPKRASFLNF